MSMTVIYTLVGYFVFSAGVGAMSAPTEDQKARFYGWFYRFLQRLAANADRLAEAKFGSLADAGLGGETAVATAVREQRESITVTASGASK